jgi:hypothetical protein
MQMYNTNKTELKSTVILPDLFKGFVVDAPRKNKHYEIVKPISERWLAEYVNFRCAMCNINSIIGNAASQLG